MHFKFWKPTKGHNSKSYGPLATILWLYLTYLRDHVEGWAQDCSNSNSNIFLKPLFRGKFDPFVNNANLGAIARTSNGT